MSNTDQADLPGGTLQAIRIRKGLLSIDAGESTPSDRSIEKRRLRKHYVLNVIRENGPLSRAEIAKTSGLNLPSVSSLVDELISDGLVAEQEARHAVRGRRPIPVYLREDAVCVLGIDIGKRTTTTLLINLGAKTLASYERPTPELTTPEAYTQWALAAADEILSSSRDFIPPLAGIGVALPGLVSTNGTSNGSSVDGTVASGESWLAVEPIRAALSQAYDVAVLVDNDARVAVPGVRWFSNGRPLYKNVAVLNVGLGLGMGVLINGHVLRGAQGFAGEIGHTPLGDPNVPCFCGRKGCLETMASGAAIGRMALEAGLQTDDVEELAIMAREGNPMAREVFADFAEALGRGVAVIINLFNPEAVILSGKVARASDVFIDDMKRSTEQHALPALLAKTHILVENPGKNLSSLGAVALVLHHIFHSSNIPYEKVI